MTKRALITGITGQDGSYLAEFLLSRGYEVYGLVRRVTNRDYSNLKNILGQINLIDGDMCDKGSLIRAVQISKPDEVYNLAAQSYVGTSWVQESITEKINADGVRKILLALKHFAPNAKFYQASTSEMFGNSHRNGLQDETVNFMPRSPYGRSKVTAFHAVRNHRESYGTFACNGILFNHESERRGYEFVTRKITNAVAQMYHGKTNVLRLGNLDSKRDWGHAEDYVKAMWLMLQQDKPDDYVVATGRTHTVRTFVDQSFKTAGLNYEVLDFSDKTPEEANLEIEKLKNLPNNYVVIDPQFFRPAEIDVLLGDASKTRETLGWEPEVSFEQLVTRMTKSDIENLSNK